MKQFIYKLGASLSILSMLILPGAAFAQLDEASNNLGRVQTELGDEGQVELPELIGQLINVFLSVLGIIFLVLIVYAGFIYMTAGGDDDKAKKAKKLLSQAVIGIIIVVAAYAIAQFVIDSITGAVTDASA